MLTEGSIAGLIFMVIGAILIIAGFPIYRGVSRPLQLAFLWFGTAGWMILLGWHVYDPRAYEPRGLPAWVSIGLYGLMFLWPLCSAYLALRVLFSKLDDPAYGRLRYSTSVIGLTPLVVGFGYAYVLK